MIMLGCRVEAAATAAMSARLDHADHTQGAKQVTHSGARHELVEEVYLARCEAIISAHDLELTFCQRR